MLKIVSRSTGPPGLVVDHTERFDPYGATLVYQADRGAWNAVLDHRCANLSLALRRLVV